MRKNILTGDSEILFSVTKKIYRLYITTFSPAAVIVMFELNS